MTISFAYFSNFFNVHQLPVALALHDDSRVDYRFVSLFRSEGEVGRDSLDDTYPFVVKGYDGAGGAREAMRLALESDIVMFGDLAGHEEYASARMGTGKPFLRDSERLLKRGQWWRYAPPKIWRTRERFLKYAGFVTGVLCTSAFTAADLDKFGFPSGYYLKWGYFPDLAAGAARQEKLPRYLSLCSAQRQIPLKHVELQLDVLQRLQERGVDARLRIAGDGPESPRLRALASSLGVDDRVEFLGQLSHRETLALMASSDVFLATSDRREGWGATVNEAMAAGCVVVGSSLMGSVPFLVRDGVDGMIFESGSIDSLESALLRLVDEPGLIPAMSRSAIDRATGLWSSSCAASRLVDLCETVLSGDPLPSWEGGPLSEAPILDDGWFSAGSSSSLVGDCA